MYTFRSVIAAVFGRNRSAAVLFGLLCAISCWLLVPRIAFSQNSVQRDQQALTILTQVITAGGGSELLTSIEDITETGKITYGANLRNANGNVIVRARGLHQLKIEADLSAGKRLTVVNGYGGSLIESDGRKEPLQGQSAVDLGSLTLPYLPLIAAMQDSSVSIIYVGLVNHNSTSVYDIRVKKVYSKQQDPQGDRGRRDTRDVYIDPNTLHITAVADRFYLGGPTHGLEHEDVYSGYQTNNGVMTPLTIVQRIGGEIGFTMNLDQVTINTNLTDADFHW